MKKWIIGKPDSGRSAEFAAKCDIDRLALEVLISRGYEDFDSIVDFFTDSEIEDPFVLKDMGKAVEVINEAVDSGDLICIYGDYDCDGVTATSILFRYLESIGANVMYYIPEREAGYGMNIAAVDYLADKDVRLIVTVDNGISAVAEADRIYEKGMKLVVTDHHQPPQVLPKAEAIVNPHQSDCRSAFKDLCGAGIAFKLCAAIDGGDYDTAFEQFSDLCAIGTVADVVPLKGENRTLVKRGIKYLANTELVGLDKLMDKVSLDRSDITSTNIAFRIAPVINASGRFGSPVTAVKTLLAEDPDDAESLVESIVHLNGMRKQTETEIMRDIFTLINSKPEILNHRVIVLAGKNWHHGVIGIVAARILEYYSKPTIIISIEENGSARGSARSVKGFNIFKCLEYSAEYLTKFGGHECAGGFSLDSDKIDDFAAKVYEFSELSETPAVSVIRADKILTPEDLTVEKVKGLSRLEPLGAENPQPVFLIAHARVDKITSLSQGKHTKLDFTYGNVRAQALMFGTQPDRLCFKVGDIIDMMVNLEINRFGGRESVSVRVLDCRRSGLKQERYFAGRDSYEKLMRGEELPQSYIRKMIPQRAELVALYKQIRQLKNTDVDTLFMYFEGAGFNYPKLHICVDIFRDKGLIGYEAASGRIKLIQVTKRVDLEQSETLQRLNKMLEGAQ